MDCVVRDMWRPCGRTLESWRHCSWPVRPSVVAPPPPSCLGEGRSKQAWGALWSQRGMRHLLSIPSRHILEAQQQLGPIFQSLTPPDPPPTPLAAFTTKKECGGGGAGGGGRLEQGLYWASPQLETWPCPDTAQTAWRWTWDEFVSLTAFSLVFREPSLSLPLGSDWSRAKPDPSRALVLLFSRLLLSWGATVSPVYLAWGHQGHPSVLDLPPNFRLLRSEPEPTLSPPTRRIWGNRWSQPSGKPRNHDLPQEPRNHKSHFRSPESLHTRW